MKENKLVPMPGIERLVELKEEYGKYKVTFLEKNPDGNWIEDYFSNNGKGFSYEDAKEIADDISKHGCDGIPIKDVKIEKIN